MNKLIILSLYLIPIFSCQGNNVVEPVKSIVPTPSQSIINYTPSPSIISSPSVLLTPIPMPSPSEMPITIDQAMIDYPDYYNQEESPKVIYSNPPIPDSIKNDSSRVIHESGRVLDRNNNPVANADITISSPIAKDKNQSESLYYFYYKTKTDNHGSYNFTAYQGININIFASKLGFTTRKINITPNSIGEEGGTHDYYFGGILDSINRYNINQSIYLSINNEPEIKDIVINKNKLYPYNINKASLEQERTNEKNIVYQYNLWFYLVNPNTEFSKLKIQNTNKLEIKIKFNKSVNKDILEENIEIRSLNGIDIYDKNSKEITFNWSENNSKLDLYIPITKYSVDKKYILNFKNGFVDSEGNKASQKMYISLMGLYNELYSELSENIIFSIAGNK